VVQAVPEEKETSQSHEEWGTASDGLGQPRLNCHVGSLWRLWSSEHYFCNTVVSGRGNCLRKVVWLAGEEKVAWMALVFFLYIYAGALLCSCYSYSNTKLGSYSVCIYA
jgi:hypothetical protein